MNVLKRWKCWTKEEVFFITAETIKDAVAFARKQFTCKSFSVREATEAEVVAWFNQK